jgi:hypothetical protein
MKSENKQRKPYSAPRIEVSPKPVLNVYAAVTQVSSTKAAAQWISSTSYWATRSTYWVVNFLGRQ